MKVINHGIFNLKVYGTFAVMDFNPNGNRYPDELVTASFERERDYLKRLEDYEWAPKVMRVINSLRQIYIEWHHNTCEDKLPDNWKEQLETIACDLAEQRIYKPSFYPKFFYTDANDTIHAYAFYSASDHSEQPIDMKFYEPILNEDRKALVDKLAVDGKLDMGVLQQHAFTDYIKWPEDALPEIYSKVYQ